MKEYSDSNNKNIEVYPFDITALNNDNFQNLMKNDARLDILINNAGCLINKSFTALSIDQWKRIFDVDLLAWPCFTSYPCLI